MFERYQTQMNVKEFGEDSQIKLQMSTVLVAGLGGIGYHTAMLLAAAGVGTMQVIDTDYVEENNLHRQLYQNSTGQSKAGATYSAIRRLNKDISVEAINCDVINALNDWRMGLPKFDLILDCLDNSESRGRLYNFCQSHNVPLISAGVGIYKGQVVQYDNGTPFMGGGEDPKISAALGPVCSVISSLQALVAINYLTNQPMDHNYIQINLKTFNIDKMRI